MYYLTALMVFTVLMATTRNIYLAIGAAVLVYIIKIIRGYAKELQWHQSYAEEVYIAWKNNEMSSDEALEIMFYKMYNIGSNKEIASIYVPYVLRIEKTLNIY